MTWCLAVQTLFKVLPVLLLKLLLLQLWLL